MTDSNENVTPGERVGRSSDPALEVERVAGEVDRQAEERTRKLAETKEELQLQAELLERLPVSAWTLKPDGTPDFVNRVWLEVTGQALDFVRSRPEAWMTAVHPEDRESVLRIFWDGVRSGQDFAMEARTLCIQDGIYRWHLHQAVVLRDAEGRVLKFAGTSTDIDDQKRAEEKVRVNELRLGEMAADLDRRVVQRTKELAEANERLQLQADLLQNLPLSAWTLKPDGTPDFVNRVWLEVAGQTLDFVRSNPEAWMTAVHPEDREIVTKAFWAGISQGQSFAMEARTLCAPDGIYRWHLHQAVVLRDAGGKVVKFVGTSTDIDDHKRAEEKLRANELRLQEMAVDLDRRVAERTKELAEANEELQLQVELLQRLPVSAWTLKPDGTPDFVNQIWLEFSGQTLDFVQSHSEAWMTAVHPEDREAASKAFWAGVRSGQDFAVETRSLRAQDETYRWHLNQAVVLRDADGRVLKFVGTTTDIDNQKRAGEEARANELRLREMTETIPAMLWSATPEGAFDYCNARFLKYTGFLAEEVMGYGWQKTIHPVDTSRAASEWVRSVKTGAPYRVEVRTLHAADRTYRWCLVSALPLLDQQGHILKWHGIISDIHERRQGEEALRESEQSFRLILDGIAGLVAIMSSAGVVEVINRQALEYFGKTSEQLVGWSTGDAVHPDDLNRVYTEWQSSVETVSVYDVDHRLRREDGAYRWFHARGLPLCDSEGHALRWYVLLTDIHDRKQAEEVLQDNERKLISIINTIPTTAWSTRPDGYCEFLSERWLSYAGMTAEECLGWNWATVIHPDDAQPLYEVWTSSLAAGTPVDTEARMRRYDGIYRWFIFRASPLRDESGNIVRWYGTNIDIDDRKRAEDQVRRSEAYLEEAQHLTRIGSFSWQVEASQITWSEQLYRIHGFVPGSPLTFELIGTRVHPDDIAVMNGVAEHARHAVSDFEYEYRLLMPDRTIRYLHSIAHATRDQKGQLEYIGAVQDVTQRRLAEEALTEARSELAQVVRVSSLGVMTASIAHEVNQPLSGIITNAGTCLRMLNSDPPNLDGARETARRTIRDGNRASDVITRLRTLYSKKEPSLEPMDMNEAAREVIALLLSELQRNRVILRDEFADRLPIVQGDRIQLQQVILNLIRNASDAMCDIANRPRRVLIRTEQVGVNVCVTVQDSGVGFDPASAGRLFESFYTTKPEGMGIGLSVSRSIIEAHGGRLWAVANDDAGATFAFSIPSITPPDLHVE